MENWKAIAEDIIKSIKVLKEENYRLETENEELKETISKILYILKNEGYVPFETIKKETNTKTLVYDYQLIDLGLPSGTLWMDRNIGASSPEDAGLYFAWGETQGYTDYEVGRTKDFTWSDYKYTNGDSNKLTKYCKDYHYSNDGYVDYLTALETIDDAAKLYTHGKCFMPTVGQLRELINETTSIWTTQNGVNGRLLTSKTNGNSIFIPTGGSANEAFVDGDGCVGCFWSCSLSKEHPLYAWCCGFDKSYYQDVIESYRCYGASVRGVAAIC